jgi:hypothetical protein
VTVEGANQVKIFDISNPTVTPVLVSTISTGAAPTAVTLQDRYLYVGTYTASKVEVYDVSNPAAPSSVGSVSTNTGPVGIAVQGRYVYTANENGATNGFQVFDFGGLYTQSLEAGSAEFGTLGVGSNAQFASDVNVQGGLAVGQSLQVDGGVSIVSNGTGTSALTINNNTTNISLLDVKDLSTNFGSAVTAGAFIQRNSYFGEEFNAAMSTATTCTGTATQGNFGWDVGDYGSHQATAGATCASANSGAGEFNFSGKLGATTASDQCVASSQNAVNGTVRLLAQSTATASNNANCMIALAATSSTSNKIYLAANLPVMTFKVKMNSLTAGSANSRIRIGMSDADSVASNALGVAPANGIYFSNCATDSTTSASIATCSNTTWYGHTFFSSTDHSVTCSIGSGASALTSNFAYLRIEVRSSTDVHFYADYSTTDGVVENECGSGLTSSPSAAMAPFVNTAVASNVAEINSVDVDYIRGWQDDNIDPNATTDTMQTTTNTAPDGSQLVTTAPISPDSPDPNVAGSFFNFLGATSEDAVFDHNVFIHGTLYVDKIKANEIEGLSIFTDQLASLQQKLAATNSTTTDPTSTTTNTTTINTATYTINLNDGLTVGGDANFQGNVFFYKLVTFVEKTVFNNDVTFAAHITTAGTTPASNLEAGAGDANGTTYQASAQVDGNDNSGSLNVTAGDNSASGKVVSVTFAKPFAKAPRIVLTATNDQTANLHYYVQSTATGFTINVTDTLNPGANLTFNYFVIQ